MQKKEAKNERRFDIMLREERELARAAMADEILAHFSNTDTIQKADLVEVVYKLIEDNN